jgi:large subunit ribosomal protein L32
LLESTPRATLAAAAPGRGDLAGSGFAARIRRFASALRRYRGAQRQVRAPCLQEIAMAVQQNKKSPSKRGMHRSHNALAMPGMALEPTTGEVHLRHHISPTGFYRGRKVVKSKADA